MSHDRIIKELKDKTCCQEELIYKLREKLVTNDKVFTQKEELQCQLNELKRWIENVEFKEKQINTDLLRNLECQSKKLKKCEASDCQLRTEKNNLLDLNDRMAEQIRTLTQNEQKMFNSLDELSMCKKRLQCELTDANGLIDEQNCCIDNLSKTLKCKENESCEMRRQLNECKLTVCRLTEASKCKETELECVKIELAELKCVACQTEEKLKCERDTLCTELEIKCQRLQEIVIEFDETRRFLCEEKANVCRLETQMEEMRYTNEKERCEAKSKIQKLKTEMCMKEESVCRMKSHIADLVQDNECKCTEIYGLKTKVQANECLLEKIKHSSDLFTQMNNNKLEQMEHDKSLLECDLKGKKKIICEMEREVYRLKSLVSNSCQTDREIGCLRSKNNELESTKCASACCPVSKCEPCCLREIKCGSSNVCPPPSCGELECGYPQPRKCIEPSSCSTNPMCPSPKPTQTCNSDNKSVFSELKRLYCDLEQLKEDTTRALIK